MSAPQLHLLIVHVPVIGVFFALLVAGAAQWWKDERLMKLGLVMLLLCGISAGIAYASGPPTYEKLMPVMSEETMNLAETHAGVARGTFIFCVLTGLFALQLLIRAAGGEAIPRWVGPVLLALLLALSIALAWTAHLGGLIRHPELRAGEVPAHLAGRSPEASSH